MKNILKLLLILIFTVFLIGCDQVQDEPTMVDTKDDDIIKPEVKAPEPEPEPVKGDIECHDDFDCGKEEILDQRCQQNMAVHRVRTPICEDAGTTDSYCSDTVQEVLIQCGEGIGSCSRGVCQEELFCTDQDDGKDYDVQTKTFTEDDAKEDHCKDSKILIEYYCDGKSRKQKEYECPGRCMNGACF